MLWPWNRSQRPLNFFGTDTYRSATCDFLLTFHSMHIGLWCCTVSEIDGDFSRNSHWRFTLGIWYRRKRSKTRMMALPDGWNTICVRQTDWQTAIYRQQRPRLRIASRVQELVTNALTISSTNTTLDRRVGLLYRLTLLYKYRYTGTFLFGFPLFHFRFLRFLSSVSLLS